MTFDVEENSDAKTLSRANEGDEERRLRAELETLQGELRERQAELAGVEVEWSEFRVRYHAKPHSRIRTIAFPDRQTRERLCVLPIS